MKNFLAFFCLIILLGMSFTPFFAHAFLLRTLKYGMSGTDVLKLQKVLNSDPETFVASTGVGSFGLETEFFGRATERAVKRFQEKYASEVLTPSGLLKSTGVVGVMTRAKISKLLSTTTVSSVTVTSPVNIPNPSLFVLPAVILATTSQILPENMAAEEKLPLITSFSGTVFRPGDTIEIKGKNFISPLSVFIGDAEFKNPSILDGNTIRITVPNKEEGPVLMWVVTSQNDTRVYQALFIIITNSSGNIPQDVLNTIKNQNEKMFSLPVSL